MSFYMSPKQFSTIQNKKINRKDNKAKKETINTSYQIRL